MTFGPPTFPGCQKVRGPFRSPICHESVPLSRIGATYADSTTTTVFTELAMKQAWCA